MGDVLFGGMEGRATEQGFGLGKGERVGLEKKGG